MNGETACNPVTVVFGAAGGIGSDVVRRLAVRGYQLMLVGRNESKLASLAAELIGSPGVRVRTCDVTVSAEVDAVFSEAKTTFGRVDSVAHCVGSIVLKAAHQTSDEEFESVLSLNLRSAFYVLRAAVRAMMTDSAGTSPATSAGGSIVLVSTVAARLGLANHEAIAAAKAGVQGLTISAAATYAPRNIRVNCVAPGLVRTTLAARITSNEAAFKASTAMHPLGRIGEPADVGSLIAFLLDPANRWITGQVFGVDGGLSTVRAR